MRRHATRFVVHLCAVNSGIVGYFDGNKVAAPFPLLTVSGLLCCYSQLARVRRGVLLQCPRCEQGGACGTVE